MKSNKSKKIMFSMDIIGSTAFENKTPITQRTIYHAQLKILCGEEIKNGQYLTFSPLEHPNHRNMKREVIRKANIRLKFTFENWHRKESS